MKTINFKKQQGKAKLLKKTNYDTSSNNNKIKKGNLFKPKETSIFTILFWPLKIILKLLIPFVALYGIYAVVMLIPVLISSMYLIFTGPVGWFKIGMDFIEYYNDIISPIIQIFDYIKNFFG